MRLLVEIDLTSADIALFDAYEAAVLPLVVEHGGRVEARVRTVDDRRETHLIFFPDTEAYSAFREDKRRMARAADWTASGASAQVSEVTSL